MLALVVSGETGVAPDDLRLRTGLVGAEEGEGCGAMDQARKLCKYTGPTPEFPWQPPSRNDKMTLAKLDGEENDEEGSTDHQRDRQFGIRRERRADPGPGCQRTGHTIH